MARDAFPAVFTPIEAAHQLRAWAPGGSFAARFHPLNSECAEAVAEDPDLRIFASPNTPFITSSAGHGAQVAADELPELLIVSASLAHNARGKSSEDREGFLEEVAATFYAFRRLIAGEEVTALTLLAFDGLSLRDGAQVETPWGLLRPATEIDAATAPMNLTPTVVLVIERPCRLIVGEDFDPDGLTAFRAEIGRATELLRLAALLGIEREDRITLGHVWSTDVEPVLLSGFGFGSPRGTRAHRAMFFPPGAYVETGGDPLTEDEEGVLQEWAELVERHHDPAIDIAVGRTLTALLERDEPQDALIDAVVALENLFGHGEDSEVTFRVTTAAALLLEPDPTKRAELRSKLSKVYTARSKVIHGASTGSLQIPERKEEAIEAAIGSLRALFSERPHLIADKERGIRLILGTADA